MRLALIALAFVFAAGLATAQQPPASIDPTYAMEIAQAQAEIHTALPGSRGRGLTDAELKARQATLPDARTKLAAALTALTPRLQDVDARLAQLGPAPASGQPAEAPAAAATRKSLGQLHETLDGEIKLARLGQVEADQASRALSVQVRANFAARLWTRSRSILGPGLWIDLVHAAPDDLSRLGATLGDQAGQFMHAAARPSRLLLMLLGLATGLLILGPVRLILDGLALRRASAVGGGNLRKSALAFWRVIEAVVAPLFAGEIIRASLHAAGAITADFDVLASLAIRAWVFASLIEGLGRSLLTPGRAALRLAPLSDEGVARLSPFPLLIGVSAGLAALAAGVDSAIGASLGTSVAVDCVTLLVELGVLIFALAAMARLRGGPSTEPSEKRPAPLLWVLAAIASWLAMALALIAVLAGYLALATLIMRETVWVSVVLSTLFIAVRFFDDLFPAVLAGDSQAGRAVAGAIGLSASAMAQIAVLASGILRLVLLTAAWLAVLAPFGASPGDFVGRIGQSRLTWKIGQVELSPAAILGALGLFLAGLLITRAVRGWLVARYLPKTRMDLGLRNSVAVGVSYLGGIIAVLLAFAYLGLSFSQIALFASALSVGIGFGLQAIIGNFVSGLILLAERPIKVGDWIAIGDLEGDVKAINIRATEIEVPDRSRLIVPNSDLVSKTVRNVTHASALGRVKIVLRVDDSADPSVVRDTVMSRLNGHKDVLPDPPPNVYMTDVRDGLLEFTAFAYVASPRYAFRVKSDLLFQLVPDLKARGVGLASQTTVVNVGLGERPIEPKDPESQTPEGETASST